MRITAEQIATSGRRVRVIDLDTGLVVRKVRWLDTDPVPTLGPGVMLLGALRVGPTGDVVKDAQGNQQEYVAKGRFKIEEVDRPVTPDGTKIGAPKCARCPSTMVLPGDDLCFNCRASDRLQKFRGMAEVVDDPFDDHKCCRCSAKATWSTSDEVEVTPRLTGFTVTTHVCRGKRYKVVRPSGDGNQRWQRASTVGRRYFCARHFAPPRLLDATGEPIRALESNHRPN